MANFDVLTQRNAAFATAGRHHGVPLMPRTGVFVVTCLDPRVDPSAFLGLEAGDAMVIRNAGGRVTDEVLLDLQLIASLAARAVPDGPLFEVALVHHTQCGTAALSDSGFAASVSEAAGFASTSVLQERAVLDPRATVLEDADRIAAAGGPLHRVAISAHVYDLATGRVTTVRPETGQATGLATVTVRQ